MALSSDSSMICRAKNLSWGADTSRGRESMSQTKPSIVFAHGLWADGSCFSKLIPTLQAEGYQVASSQHSLDAPEGDVAALLHTLGRVSSPAILVGHSYGGSVITAAGTDDRADGRIWLLPSGTAYFAGDLSEQEQQLVWATQVTRAPDLFSRNAPGTAWKSKPSWYIVANTDHTVHPELERFAAKRMGATTYEVDSSHVPMLSQPGLVLDVIRAAANGV